MKKNEMIEVRFHSRGGQGGVTAAKLVGIAAFMEGKHSSSFSFYGAERRGLPTVSFTRISSSEIKIYSPIMHPDCVVILDSSLIRDEIQEENTKNKKKVLRLSSCSIHPKDGLEMDKKVVINSENSNAQGLGLYEVHVVNATRIALDLGLKVAGAPVLNVPILGAVAKAGIVKLYSVKKAIAANFPDERNIKAVEIAYKKVRRVKNEKY